MKTKHKITQWNITGVLRAADGSGQHKENRVTKVLFWLHERKVVSMYYVSVKTKLAGEKLFDL